MFQVVLTPGPLGGGGKEMKNPSNFCCVRLTFFGKKKAEALEISLNTWRLFEPLGLGKKKNIVWYKNLYSCITVSKNSSYRVTYQKN